jgi:hypothetical protein
MVIEGQDPNIGYQPTSNEYGSPDYQHGLIDDHAQSNPEYPTTNQNYDSPKRSAEELIKVDPQLMKD